jgi:hypothetical protein
VCVAVSLGEGVPSGGAARGSGRSLCGTCSVRS